MPRLDAIPPGCAFHPRCAHLFARCVVERPRLEPLGATQAACWLYDPGPSEPAGIPTLAEASR
jgi:peptide/nickel transport system ATP-binding protein